MKPVSIIFLKTVLGLIAAVALFLLIWFPQTEGRAEGLDPVSIYTDFFIIYIYIASIPFFTALFQAFKLLGFIEENKIFTPVSVGTLRNIKYCGLTIVAFLIGAIGFVMFNHGDEDAAGAIAVGLVITFAATVVSTAAAVFQKLLQTAVDIKSENDLTV